jgi:cytochrome c oxidase subunit 2
MSEATRDPNGEPTGNTQGLEHNPNLPDLHVDRYEAAWMRISLVTIAVFVVAIVISTTSYGIQVPGVTARIDPNTLMTPPNPFAEPGLRELAPGKYEAYIRAQVWSFAPSEIRVPVGSQVTFYATAMDVQHGLKIVGTNVNFMVLPGQISKLTATFDQPGTYNFICHEYCGAGGPTIGHHTMYGQIIVEEAAVAADRK